ncbi:MAG: hypothetical protein ACOYM3_25400 [Terrimicrobiaceae bacterium]
MESTLAIQGTLSEYSLNMPRFEYKTLLVESPEKISMTMTRTDEHLLEVEKAINDLGDQGWEMTGVFPLSRDGEITFGIHYFKRLKPD